MRLTAFPKFPSELDAVEEGRRASLGMHRDLIEVDRAADVRLRVVAAQEGAKLIRRQEGDIATLLADLRGVLKGMGGRRVR